MAFSPSRNHWTAAPAMKTLPSRANWGGSSPSEAARVVISPWFEDDERRAGVGQQEGAGAIGALGLAGLEAALADQRGLLVAGDAR